MRRLPLLVAPLLSFALALSACSGGDSKEPKKEAETTPSVTPSVAPAITSPLTGLAMNKLPKRPVVVVKIDNVSQAAPQDGLDQADMVVEELVEGGVTRLAAFYYSTLPERVGPVRSMRTSDIGIVSPVQARIITSGAAPETIAALRAADVPFVQEGAKGFSRDSSRYAPHNLFADPRTIAPGLAVSDQDPVDYFHFSESNTNPRGKKAASFQAHFGSRSTAWSWTNGAWVNANTFMAPEELFTPDTIVALEVEVTDAGYGGYNGAFVPESHLEGTGKAWIFHEGRMVQGTWTKDAPDATITLSKGDQKLTVPAGKTFVELVPQGEGGVSVGQ